jgi:MFS family permease
MIVSACGCPYVSQILKGGYAMSKGKGSFFAIAVMFCNIAIMGELIVTPIFYNIYAAFPNDTFAVNAIVSGPSLMVVLASLLSTVLMKRLSKKSIIIGGGLLFTLCGIAGGIFSNVYVMLIARLLYGLGVGTINVAAVALIAEVYTDEIKRGSFMGIFNAVMAAVGAVFGMASGILATAAWQNSFRLYWLGVPMLFMTIFFLPAIKPAASGEGGENTPAQAARKAPLGKSFWSMFWAFTLFSLVYSLLMFFTSTYVAENSLGTEAFAGALTSLGTVGSFCFCLAFGLVYRKLKQAAVLPTYFFAILGMGTLFLFPFRTVAIVVCTLFGGFYGIAFTYMYTHCPAIIPEERIDDSVGFITASYGLASFLLPYMVSALMGAGLGINLIFGIGALVAVPTVIIQFTAFSGKRGGGSAKIAA